MTQSTSFNASFNRTIPPLGTLLAFALGGCAPSETEVFEETEAALSVGVGESCSPDVNVAASEINVDDHSAACQAGLACVSVGEAVATDLGVAAEEGLCSCQCDGPEGGGPYCNCTDGFWCAQLIEDLGLRTGAASYCMPEQDR